MAWAHPRYSRARVDAAGVTLVDPRATRSALNRALAIISNWRSSHSFPLNTFQVSLRLNARAVDPNSLVAQRLKRLSSIELKLRRFGEWLTLSEMQDLGGCRAIVSSVKRVGELVAHYRSSSMRHELVDFDDYIRQPKKSGYRGCHLIYKYISDRKDTYNGLKIELQFRSPLQHAWATAVETVGRFTYQALKSSLGAPDWLRFFALMGTAIARRERTPLVPNTPEDPGQLLTELRDLASRLDVVRRLHAYRDILKPPEQHSLKNAHYYLITLNPEAGSVAITGFASQEREIASTRYLETERSLAATPGADAVLVSVESLADLRRAYPNYFFDTKVFLDTVERALNPRAETASAKRA